MDIEELQDKLGKEFVFIFNDINPVLQDLELEKTAKILDVGTGMGWMAIILALNNFKVITGEPESDESEYAKQDWLESAKKAKVDHMITHTPFKAEEMPFEDASFDAIFILGSLHHVDDQEATLKESIRVLRLNGIICIFEPNDNLMKIIRENKFPSHPDAVDPQNYTQELHLSLELIERPYYNAYILRKQ
ncbi:MAG: class I SAM-dependent methyltransferase [Promethearchaeota archaeon]|jgi:ubiquinone/menaquinone biosynthesis C-methylase UbiE